MLEGPSDNKQQCRDFQITYSNSAITLNYHFASKVNTKLKHFLITPQLFGA